VLQKIHKTAENVNVVVGEPTLISVCKQIKQNNHRQPTPQLVVTQVAERIAYILQSQAAPAGKELLQAAGDEEAAAKKVSSIPIKQVHLCLTVKLSASTGVL